MQLSAEGVDFIMGMSIVTKGIEKDEEIPRELEAVSKRLWSKRSTDVGLLVSAQRVHIKTKGGPPPAIKQYPIPWEAKNIYRNK